LAPVIVLLAIMMAAGGGVGGHDNAWHAAQKPTWVLLAMNGYSRYFSAISVVTVVLLLWLLRRQGLLSFGTPAGRWIAAGFLLAFLALPFRLFDTAFADVRVVTAAAFVLPAFVAIEIPNARAARVLLAVGGRHRGGECRRCRARVARLRCGIRGVQTLVRHARSRLARLRRPQRRRARPAG